MPDSVGGAQHPPQRSEFASGPWPQILLLVAVLGIVAGFMAGFWVGIMALCFGIAAIATLPAK